MFFRKDKYIVIAGIILLQSFVLAQQPVRPVAGDPLQISRVDRLNVFDKTWETVNRFFFQPQFNGVNWKQMKQKYRPIAEAATDKAQLAGVIQPMLGELHASHTGFRGDGPPSPYGTGVHYVPIDGKWLVDRIAPGSAAQVAGLERGWILTGSEGECTAPGKKVTVQLLDLQDKVRRAELPCAVEPAMTASTDNFRALENGAIYLRLSFDPALLKWLADQVARNQSASAIVLDLRGNGGGGTETQRKVFDLFFSAKTIFGKFRFRNGKEYTLESGGSKSAYRGRLIVLTDRNTQSAAESFSQGIQETGRGIVIGQQTRGVVLLGNHFKLPNGFDLHLAVADYHTAKGIRLEQRGVIPDVAVDDLTVKDFRENRDPVLERVGQILRAPTTN